MFKRLLIQVIIDFVALFVVFCGIDKLLGNEVAIGANLLFAIIFSVLKNLMGMRKYYVHNIEEQDNNETKED